MTNNLIDVFSDFLAFVNFLTKHKCYRMYWQNVRKKTFSCQEYWAMTVACFAHCGSCLARDSGCDGVIYLIELSVPSSQTQPTFTFTQQRWILWRRFGKNRHFELKKTLNKMRNLSAWVLSETWNDIFRFFFIFFCSKRLFFHLYNPPISLQNIHPRHPEPHSFPHFIFSPWSCQSQH